MTNRLSFEFENKRHAAVGTWLSKSFENREKKVRKNGGQVKYRLAVLCFVMAAQAS